MEKLIEESKHYTLLILKKYKVNMFLLVANDSNEKNELKINLIKTWNAGRAVIGNEECFILLYVIERVVSEKTTHVMKKAVMITKSRKIIYEVHGSPCDVDRYKLPIVLNDIRMLPDILKRFKDYRICKGVKTFDFNFLTGPTKNVYSQPWRTDNCTLLSLNRDRCPACQKQTRTLPALNYRKNKTKKFQRISRPLNPVDQNRQILKKRVQLLEKAVAESKTSIANLP